MSEVIVGACVDWELDGRRFHHVDYYDDNLVEGHDEDSILFFIMDEVRALRARGDGWALSLADGWEMRIGIDGWMDITDDDSWYATSEDSPSLPHDMSIAGRW